MGGIFPSLERTKRYTDGCSFRTRCEEDKAKAVAEEAAMAQSLGRAVDEEAVERVEGARERGEGWEEARERG